MFPSSFSKWAEEFPGEMDTFLYYCPNEIMCPGAFEFVKVKEEQTTPHEWEALNEWKEKILEKFRPGPSRHYSILENQDSEGRELSRFNMPVDWQPKITFVALVVDSVRR